MNILCFPCFLLCSCCCVRANKKADIECCCMTYRELDFLSEQSSRSTIEGLGLHVPSLQQLNLGRPLYSSTPFEAHSAKVITSANLSQLCPQVTLIKHYLSNFGVVQAMIRWIADGAEVLQRKCRKLGEVSFVIVNSSDEALLLSANVPI